MDLEDIIYSWAKLIKASREDRIRAQERVEICKKCSNLSKLKVCSLCGCPIKAKVFSRNPCKFWNS